jgi:hypothetical protein
MTGGPRVVMLKLPTQYHQPTAIRRGSLNIWIATGYGRGVITQFSTGLNVMAKASKVPGWEEAKGSRQRSRYSDKNHAGQDRVWGREVDNYCVPSSVVEW